MQHIWDANLKNDWDVCDFDGNVALWFKQDFDACKLFSFGHDSYFQRNVAGLLTACWNHTLCYNNPTLEHHTFDKNSILS